MKLFARLKRWLGRTDHDRSGHLFVTWYNPDEISTEDNADERCRLWTMELDNGEQRIHCKYHRCFHTPENVRKAGWAWRK